MRRIVVPAIADTAARTDPKAARVVVRTVLNIRERQRARRQLILLRRRRARDIRTLQVRIALHGDVEAAVASPDRPPEPAPFAGCRGKSTLLADRLSALLGNDPSAFHDTGGMKTLNRRDLFFILSS